MTDVGGKYEARKVEKRKKQDVKKRLACKDHHSFKITIQHLIFVYIAP